MKTSIKKKSKLVRKNIKSTPPRPIPVQECACGCGFRFQPNRRDQVYLNKQHADFGYNNGKRKEDNKIENSIIKTLRRNDRLLRKYFETEDKEVVGCYKDILVADGFDFTHSVSSVVSNEIYYFYLYNYIYNISINNKREIINIYKK